MPLIDIFRAGKRSDANGNDVDITTEQLQQTVANYDPTLHEAPLVIGHPEDNAPAWGWVKKLKLDGDTLQAAVDEIDPDFADLVKTGKYKKISASFYLPDSPHNPKKGVLSLRHVGFLGAMPPAVKGLAPVAFADNEQGIIDFNDVPPTDIPLQPNEPKSNVLEGEQMSTEDRDELERLRAENEQLKSEKAKAEAEKAEATLNQAKAENTNYAESLVKAGKLAPIAKAQAVELLNYGSTLANGGVLEFGEGESLHSKIQAFLEAQPKQIEFGEVATKEKAVASNDDSIVYAEGTDPQAIETDKAVREYMKVNNVSYTDAFNAIHG